MFLKIYKLKEKYISIYLLPLLILYIILIIKLNPGKLSGDEPRYIWYADNILKGYYSPPAPDINLWNGPGYPLLLAGIKLIINKIIFFRLINSLFLYLAVFYFTKSLLLLDIKLKKTIFFSYLMGLANPYLLSFLPLILTESFTVFLVTLIMYLVIKIYHKNEYSFLNIVLLGFFLGYLALTKIIFGYVIATTMIVLLILNFLRKKDKRETRFVIYTLLFSLLTVLPYLLYTYKLTNKLFYWGNSGGFSLYWMSSPFKHELGDWYGTHFMKRDKNIYNNLKETDYFEYLMLEARDSVLYKNHSKFFKKINKLNSIESDQALKKQAIKNIYNHPLKYFKNWIANIGRIFFHYPFSYRDQTINTFIVLVPNMFIIVFFILAFIIALLIKNQISFDIYFLNIFFSIYFIGSSIVSAYGRMFFPIYPFFILFILYIFNKFVIINIKKFN